MQTIDFQLRAVGTVRDVGVEEICSNRLVSPGSMFNRLAIARREMFFKSSRFSTTPPSARDKQLAYQSNYFEED